jgi:tripartite-type tricarboxylate transporter receptor subunit TctC
MKKGRHLVSAILAVVLSVLSMTSFAQAYPSKPIRFIVPFPPGGGTDLIGRTVGQRVSMLLGQQVVVENRAGAGGMIGVEAAVRSAPDGYTVVIAGVGELSMFPSLYRKLPYDTMRDLQAIGLIAITPQILVVNQSVLPVTSLRELIQYAKANPGKINYGSFGTGSLAHVMTELLAGQAGIQITNVSYKGSAPALNDLLGGQIGLLMLSPALAKSHVESGRLLGIAVSSKERLAALPNIPSVHEAGVPNYDATSWFGALVPAGTPRETVAQLNDAIVKAVNSPEVSKLLLSNGILPLTNNPQEFSQFIKQEIDKWGAIIKKLGLTLD